MTITEAKLAKAALADKIKADIILFENTSGMVVAEINLHKVTLITNEDKKHVITDVLISVVL